MLVRALCLNEGELYGIFLIFDRFPKADSAIDSQAQLAPHHSFQAERCIAYLKASTVSPDGKAQVVTLQAFELSVRRTGDKQIRMSRKR